MASNVYVDEKLEMMCEGLFDNIEDLLDFSSDDELLGINSGDNNKDDDIHISQATTSFPNSGEGSRVTTASEENKVCEEIEGVDDWITNFLDDSNFKLDCFPAATRIIAEKDAAIV
ncbi:uncharacterized protein LOC109850045 [Asparagus officinalis]|nr:uncharacterized protein LOC109850045 [Asparagus officinalis]